MAPRPLIMTEGGPTHALDLVRRAYEVAGAPDHVTIHYYPKYADPAARRDGEPIPEGLDQTVQQSWKEMEVPFTLLSER
jgi:hypothetical protein